MPSLALSALDVASASSCPPAARATASRAGAANPAQCLSRRRRSSTRRPPRRRWSARRSSLVRRTAPTLDLRADRVGHEPARCGTR
jgi:hypothetical protein